MGEWQPKGTYKAWGRMPIGTEPEPQPTETPKPRFATKDFLKNNTANNERINTLRSDYNLGELPTDRPEQISKTADMLQEFPFVRQGVSPLIQELTSNDNVASPVKVTKAVLHSLLGTAMSPLNESIGLIEKAGQPGKEIAQGINQTFNLPFQAIGMASKGYNELLKPLGLSADTDTEKAINDLLIEGAGLSLLGKMHKGTKDFVENKIKLPEIKTEVWDRVRPNEQTRLEPGSDKINLDELLNGKPEVKNELQNPKTDAVPNEEIGRKGEIPEKEGLQEQAPQATEGVKGELPPDVATALERLLTGKPEEKLPKPKAEKQPEAPQKIAPEQPKESAPAVPPIESGKSETVYHGKADVGNLDFSRSAPQGNQIPYGVHFTKDKSIAESFANGETKGKPTGQNGEIVEGEIVSKNPFDVSKRGIFREGTKEFEVLREIARKSRLRKTVRPYSDELGNFVLGETSTKTIPAVDPSQILDNAPKEIVKEVLTKYGYDPVIKYAMKGTKDPLGGGMPEYTDAWAVLDEAFVKTKTADRPSVGTVKPPVQSEPEAVKKESGADLEKQLEESLAKDVKDFEASKPKVSGAEADKKVQELMRKIAPNRADTVENAVGYAKNNFGGSAVETFIREGKITAKEGEFLRDYYNGESSSFESAPESNTTRELRAKLKEAKKQADLAKSEKGEEKSLTPSTTKETPDNNRTAAIRMLSEGKKPREIAETLKMPVREVAKLQKEGKPSNVENLKDDLIKLRDNYNTSEGSAKTKQRRPILNKIQELRAQGIDAKFEQGQITIDGKPIRKAAVQPEKVDITKVEVRPEAEKRFEELDPEVKGRQEILVENFVTPEDLPSGSGEAVLKKGIEQIKNDNGQEQLPEAKIVRDAAEHILENGKEVTLIKGSRGAKKELSPEEVKGFVDEKLTEKGDTSFEFGDSFDKDKNFYSSTEKNAAKINEIQKEIDKLRQDRNRFKLESENPNNAEPQFAKEEIAKTDRQISKLEAQKNALKTQVDIFSESSAKSQEQGDAFKPKRLFTEEEASKRALDLLNRHGKTMLGEGKKFSELAKQDIEDLLYIGGHFLEKGAYKLADDFGKWSKEMVDLVGDVVKPYLKDVWDKTFKPPEATTKPKIETAETKVRGLAKSTEARAIVNGVTKAVENLPTYEVKKNQPQIEAAAELIANDIELAKRIEFGQEDPPKGIIPGFIHRGLEVYATEKGDVQLIKELATSPYLSEQATVAGQFIQSFRDQDPLSPVNAIKEVTKAREESRAGQREKILTDKYTKQISDLEKQLGEKDELIKKAEAQKAVARVRKESYGERKAGRTRTKEQIHEERKKLALEIYQQMSANVGIPLDAKVIKNIGLMTKGLVEEGIIDVAQIVDTIHEEIKGKIDKRLIRDAISGYGKENKQTRSEITKTISDLRQQMQAISKIEDIEAGKEIPKKTITKSTPSEDLITLKSEVKEKLKESGITEQDNLAKSKEQLKKKIIELHNKIKEGDYAKEEKTVSPIDAEKAELKKRLDEVRTRWNDIQKNLGEKITDEEAKTIADLSKKATEAKAKMDSVPEREFGKEQTPEEQAAGDAITDFQNYVTGLKEDADKLTWKEFKESPLGEKIGLTGKGIAHIPGMSKSLKATFDNSGLFNQNMLTLLTHPVIWQKNALKSFQDIADTFGGKNVMNAINSDMVTRPNYRNGLYKQEKVAINTVEEALPDSGLLEKIPYLGRVHKAANVAFTGLAYRNRMDVFDLLVEHSKNVGMFDKLLYSENNPKSVQGLGKVTNSLTGRGSLGSLDKNANVVNVLMFAPRFVKSHVDVLTAHLFSKDMGRLARVEAGTNLLKIVGGIAAIATAANAVKPGSVELDPNSTDFMKIKSGNTRFNFTGGLAPFVTLASRLITQSTKNAKGETVELNTGKYGAMNTFDVLVNFMNGKLSPVAGVVRDVLKGQTFGGERVTVGKELLSLAEPLPINNYRELMRDPNSANVLAAMIADALGVFTNTYSNDPELRKVKDTLLKADEEKLSRKQKANFRISLRKAWLSGSITDEQKADYLKQFDELQKDAKEKEPGTKSRITR